MRTSGGCGPAWLQVRGQKHRLLHAAIQAAEGRFFCNGLDLAWLDSSPAAAGERFTHDLNATMARLLCFPRPTVAALNGHWCAAGGQLGLCTDYRVMNASRGFFFVPAVDLGVVYSPFQVRWQWQWWQVGGTGLWRRQRCGMCR